MGITKIAEALLNLNVRVPRVQLARDDIVGNLGGRRRYENINVSTMLEKNIVITKTREVTWCVPISHVSMGNMGGETRKNGEGRSTIVTPSLPPAAVHPLQRNNKISDNEI